jgi:hypothetical protein
MKRCPVCGKKGWFLILINGLCEDCLNSKRTNAMQGKLFINNFLTNRYNSFKDSYEIKGINDSVRKLQEKIVSSAIAGSLEEATVIITLSIDSTVVGRYSDGSFAEKANIKVHITDNERNLLFSETFEGIQPADKIYRRPNELAGTVTGSLPLKTVVNYLDNLLKRYRIHIDKH